MFAGEPAPFVMELPAYHMPTVGNVLRSMWERGWSFIKKAGTIITLSTIVVWFLMNFGWTDGHFGMLNFDGLEGAAMEAAQAQCVLAKIGNLIAWIFAPLGWGNWKMAVAAITGLVAKENVVGTFGTVIRICRSCRRRKRNLGITCKQHDSDCSLFLPCIQPSMCTLLRSNGSY